MLREDDDDNVLEDPVVADLAVTFLLSERQILHSASRRICKSSNFRCGAEWQELSGRKSVEIRELSGRRCDRRRPVQCLLGDWCPAGDRESSG